VLLTPNKRPSNNHLNDQSGVFCFALRQGPKLVDFTGTKPGFWINAHVSNAISECLVARAQV
jgi:hypothetical protein